eukprot:3933712-Rhodomonas_salina.1
MGEIPLTRMDWRKWYDPEDGAGAKSYTNRGAFIKGVTLFDHVKFGISTAEARDMDPQHRIALEVVYEAMTQAGLTTSTGNKPLTGVFGGQCCNDFLSTYNLSDTTAYRQTGVAMSITSNRISYVFGLKGPSFTVDTACSSSLVAADAACKAIYSNDCETAVIFGVNLILAMENFVGFSASHMLSREGRCASFSDMADGFARAEGCGAI